MAMTNILRIIQFTVGRMHRPFPGGPLYLSMLDLLPWHAYPIAIYMISKHARQIRATASLRDNSSEMVHSVRREERVRDINTRCLSEQVWEMIPWELVVES